LDLSTPVKEGNDYTDDDRHEDVDRKQSQSRLIVPSVGESSPYYSNNYSQFSGTRGRDVKTLPGSFLDQPLDVRQEAEDLTVASCLTSQQQRTSDVRRRLNTALDAVGVLDEDRRADDLSSRRYLDKDKDSSFVVKRSALNPAPTENSAESNVGLCDDLNKGLDMKTRPDGCNSCVVDSVRMSEGFSVVDSKKTDDTSLAKRDRPRYKDDSLPIVIPASVANLSVKCELDITSTFQLQNLNTDKLDNDVSMEEAVLESVINLAAVQNRPNAGKLDLSASLSITRSSPELCVLYAEKDRSIKNSTGISSFYALYYMRSVPVVM